jgi:hypothetical protein
MHGAGDNRNMENGASGVVDLSELRKGAQRQGRLNTLEKCSARR